MHIKNSTKKYHKTYIVSHNENYRRLIIERDYKKGKYVIDFFIAGYKYNDGKDIIEHLGRNEYLEFVREPFNPYDKYAIAIYSKDFIRLGYVPHIVASFLAPQIDNGKKVKAVIKTINNNLQDDFCTSDETKLEVRVSLNIKMFKPHNIENKI